jgi:hypothetical protein
MVSTQGANANPQPIPVPKPDDKPFRIKLKSVVPA